MKKLSLVVAMLLGGTVLALAGEMAVVDMEMLVKAHPKSDVHRDILRDQLAEMESEKEAMLETLDEKKEAFLDARRAAADPALSEAVRGEREEEAGRQLQVLQEMEQQMRERLMARQREMNDQKLRMHELVEEGVQKLVARVATTQDISFVVDKSAVGVSGSRMVVFHEEKLDITDQVMQEIQALREAQ